jgi:hypothetical protein
MQDNDQDFYADDVNAQGIAENKQDPDLLQEKEEIPVSSGEMEIGDLDSDETKEGESYDEESTPIGDNVV